MVTSSYGAKASPSAQEAGAQDMVVSSQIVPDHVADSGHIRIGGGYRLPLDDSRQSKTAPTTP